MLAPPPRTNVAGTPSNAVAKTALGQLWDYVTERLGGAEGNFNYGNSLTGGTGVINIGSGQIYKDASGNLGVGTSSPSEKLTVNGNAFLKGNRALIFQQDSGVAAGTVSFRNSAGVQKAAIASYYNVGDEGALEFLGPTGSTNMMLTSSGNLLVGCTSAPGNIPNTSGLFMTANGYIAFRVAAHVTFAQEFFNSTGTAVGNITVNANSTSYNTSSDYRLKKDIRPMTGALARNALLEPVCYRWKVDDSEGEGFIADKLQGPFPNAVTGKKDGMRTEQYVAGTRTVIKQRQVTDLQIEEREEIVLIDGKRVLRMVEHQVSVPLFEDVPVYNEDGSVATITTPAVLGADGQVLTPETTVTRTVQVPVMQEYEEQEDVMGEREVPDYQGIGTGPLDGHFTACINELQAIIQTLTARIAALEAAQ